MRITEKSPGFEEPDKKHSFGYGRIEYLSAMIISVIVLYAGITSFAKSVKNIILTAIGVYSVNATDEEVIHTKQQVENSAVAYFATTASDGKIYQVDY